MNHDVFAGCEQLDQFLLNRKVAGMLQHTPFHPIMPHVYGRTSRELSCLPGSVLVHN